MNILLIHQSFLEEDDPRGSRFNEMAKIWTGEGHNVNVLAGTHLTETKREKNIKVYIQN